MRKPIISWINYVKVLLLSLLSSGLTLTFIYTVNFLISRQISGNGIIVKPVYGLFLLLFIALYTLVRIYFSYSTIKLSQYLFWELRMDIVGIMGNAKFSDFKKQSPKITTCLISDVSLLTQSAEHSIYFLTSLITMTLCMGYLFYLSQLLFVITLVVIICGALVYHLSFKRNQFFLKAARNEEQNFIQLLDALINGFKEIFLDQNKRIILGGKKLNQIRDSTIGFNISAFTGISLNQLIGQVLFFALILVVLLFSNKSFGLPVTTAVNFVFILLFLRSAIETTMVLLPGLYQANIAYKRITELRDTLASGTIVYHAANQGVNEFSVIQIKVLTYSYSSNSGNEHGFAIGPVNIELERGQVYFIYGGNGSGKTTFVMLLLGLLDPDSGQIFCDGVLVTPLTIANYKIRFGAVFSDYYLFNEVFYDNIDPLLVNQYIVLFELNDKVTWRDNAFSTKDLSMGQKKRLALIAVLLENKPIIVLDEWAADQDPYFRQKFYVEIIPLLKQKGFTILAVTHDDKYYHCADYLYKMQEGTLVNVVQENLNFAG